MDEFADHKILVLKLNAAPAVLLLCTDAQKYSSTMLVVHKSFVDQMISFYVNIYEENLNLVKTLFCLSY